MEPDDTAALQGQEGASTRIVKLVIMLVALALGIYVAANALRQRWVLAGVGLSGALLCVALYALLAQIPRLGRTIGLVVGALLVGIPPGFYVLDPAAHVAAMPLMAVAAVVVLSLLSPVTGLVAIGVETLALVMFAVTSGHLSLQTVVSFAVVAAPVHVMARWLAEALQREGRLHEATLGREPEPGRVQPDPQRRAASERAEGTAAAPRAAPLIEVMPGTGLVVVTGSCGRARVSTIETALFTALQERSLHTIVIDVSAADLQAEGLDALTLMLRALQTMVSDVVLCGISPDAARGIAGDRARMGALKQAARFAHTLREALLLRAPSSGG